VLVFDGTSLPRAIMSDFNLFIRQNRSRTILQLYCNHSTCWQTARKTTPQSLRDISYRIFSQLVCLFRLMLPGVCLDVVNLISIGLLLHFSLTQSLTNSSPRCEHVEPWVALKVVRKELRKNFLSLGDSVEGGESRGRTGHRQCSTRVVCGCG
jgi:hypothetical protein